MSHEVIMPALGMAQDTGLIVAWHKAAGDAVAAGEVLMEVETDKAVMEVEAGADGYVAELRAESGVAVPVGDVVAVITADKPRNVPQEKPKPAERAASESPPKPETPPKPEPPAAKPAPKPAAIPVAAGRVLASPKAKRIAAEQGLDLNRLARAGHPQPYHVADLDRLANLAAAAPSGERDRIEARVPKYRHSDFLSWIEAETGTPADRLAVLAAFAAASLRVARDAQSLVVAAERPGMSSVLYGDPDLCGLTAIVAVETGAADLVLRDLTQSRITAMRLGGDAVPVLTLASNGDDYMLALDFTADTLEVGTAISLMNEMAARLEEPLRHLL